MGMLTISNGKDAISGGKVTNLDQKFAIVCVNCNIVSVRVKILGGKVGSLGWSSPSAAGCRGRMVWQVQWTPSPLT